MRTFKFILIILSLGCYKKNAEMEAIPIDNILFKTILKNHTPGIDYIINKSLDISKELIIEEGVEIIVEAGCELIVIGEGVIQFNGSSGKPVIIKGKDKTARWNGIIIHSKGDNKVLHTEISGAGALGDNHAAIEVQPGGNILLSHCKIEDNGEASGILITEKAKCIISDGCQLSNNNFPIQMDLHASLSMGNGCNISDNANKVIKIRNQDDSPFITKNDLKFQNYGIPYFITSPIIIDRNKLTISEGVTLLFESNTGISTSSVIDMSTSFTVNGTGNNKVILGSFRKGTGEQWKGVDLGSGYNKIYYAVFNASNSKIKDLAILNIRNYAGIDCKFSTFYSDKSFCNISLVGKYISFNSNIFTVNTFNNNLLPCIIL